MRIVVVVVAADEKAREAWPPDSWSMSINSLQNPPLQILRRVVARTISHGVARKSNRTRAAQPVTELAEP